MSLDPLILHCTVLYLKGRGSSGTIGDLHNLLNLEFPALSKTRLRRLVRANPGILEMEDLHNVTLRAPDLQFLENYFRLAANVETDSAKVANGGNGSAPKAPKKMEWGKKTLHVLNLPCVPDGAGNMRFDLGGSNLFNIEHEHMEAGSMKNKG